MEIYTDPRASASATSPRRNKIVGALDLAYEPVLFTIDGTGTVVRRLDSLFDQEEVIDAASL